MDQPQPILHAPQHPIPFIETALPEERDTNSVLLEQAHQTILRSYPKMHSLLLVRQGKLIFERYYGHYQAGSLNDLRSVTKSFISLMTGIAIKRGDMPCVETPFCEVLHRHLPSQPSPQLKFLTLRHLLTMTAGFSWITGKKLGEPLIRKFHNSRRWGNFALSLPILPDSIGTFQYRSTDSHLISLMLSESTGVDTFSYARQHFFTPLGITHVAWSSSPEGHSMGHIGLYLTARDMAKTALCLLNGGFWAGEEIVPQAWLQEALKPQTSGYPAFGAYGYQFWSGTMSGQPFQLAHGHGGQQILLLPRLDAAVIFTAETKVRQWKNPRRLMEQYLIPAMS
ncbi:serine hydrolase domain-containing protein [Paenibacillus sp. GCM10012306]|uniref:serine hydrolase domain-containing protein n=1 Tax=Paenibacillus sp. GCM10012306 TaxID=3317342 RepID=UPI00360E094F